ncbi:hypothetical protein FYK55_02100 [Roseiconus nitratireducens]|uniref:Uncharacterized protein n=1 Tax=Roseiconus nitratireducens TaxID=2605748 RepID=A0A5M6DI31_9BACT|nr:hypothetical protein [Roseiconus nitratireducens]KAA5547217.1 hypothetical protein FYK55_02100 [Roseiconus nitratireducens]
MFLNKASLAAPLRVSRVTEAAGFAPQPAANSLPLIALQITVFWIGKRLGASELAHLFFHLVQRKIGAKAARVVPTAGFEPAT